MLVDDLEADPQVQIYQGWLSAPDSSMNSYCSLCSSLSTYSLALLARFFMIWKWQEEGNNEDHTHRDDDHQIACRNREWSNAHIMSRVVEGDSQKSHHDELPVLSLF